MPKNVIDRITELMVEFPRLMHRRMLHTCRQNAVANMLQIHALAHLHEQEGMTMTELAKILQVSSPSATSFVNRLVKTGWVERSSDVKNRKLVRLHVTPAGERVLQHTRQARNDVFAEILQALTTEECLAFEQIMRKLLTSARKGASH